MYRRFGLKVNPWVFFTSVAVVLVFLGLGAAWPVRVGAFFADMQDWIVETFGWLYIVAVAFFLVFVIWIGLSRHGRIRLGDDDEQAEYGFLSWFAMLFSAGMGIGLLFFSVAEPILHFIDPPVGAPETVDAAQRAIHLTFFHWGLHAWSIYIIVGLSLAYFAYRHDLPLTIRSAFYPLLGDRIYGMPGNVVDTFAVFGTLFGLATSLGLGVMQINAGLHHLGWMEISTSNQVVLITVITLMASVSVGLGLDRGIRRLSELNLFLGLILLLFIFAMGPTVFMLSTFVQSVGTYMQSLIGTTLSTDAFIGPAWQKAWTMFYWGWWIAWSPFVGMFIARISRGRTIREFVFGVLLVPTLLTFIWLTVFGGSAIHIELFGDGGIISAVETDVALSLYALLGSFPLDVFTSVLATIVIVTYFVTSADSGSLVIDILTSDGDTEPPVFQRIFWALAVGAVAGVLLLAGGLVALQTVAITTALPFTVIMLFMCFSLVKGLRAEPRPKKSVGASWKAEARALAGREGDADLAEGMTEWRTILADAVQRRRALGEKKKVRPRTWGKMEDFFQSTVLPAFHQLAEELGTHDIHASIDETRDGVVLRILSPEGEEEFFYGIRTMVHHRMSFAYPDFTPKEDSVRRYRAEAYLPSGPEHYDVSQYDREQIIRDFLHDYRKWLGWQRL